MSDIKTPEERSINMSHIRSRDTKPEVFIRKELFKRGYRYRIAAKNVAGHPDMWLKKYNTAVFIHGCFWHRHPGCKYAYTPKSNVDFWIRKFDANIERDERVRLELQKQHIKQLIIWECTIKKAMKDNIFLNNVMNKVEIFLKSEETKREI